MGNAQKPTTHTQHIDIKYFSLCEWVERSPMILGQIDTSINMADHLTKALQPTLFHRHADFLLSHIPPTYSPLYTSIIGDFPNHTPKIDLFIPASFTAPITAAAARVYAPINSLTAIEDHDRQYFNELRSTVVSRRIFICSQSLIAR